MFLSASFDIVFGAYLIEIVDERQQSPAAAMFVIGYRVAFVVAGAGILLVADRAGWRVAIGLTAPAMMLLAILSNCG